MFESENSFAHVYYRTVVIVRTANFNKMYIIKREKCYGI